MGFEFDAAIAGIGLTAIGKFPDRSNLDLVAEAFRKALDDSGIQRSEVDGIVTNVGHPLGVDYDQFATVMGLDIRFANQAWTHGRFVGTMLHTAALAVTAGMADCVACICGIGFTKLGQVGGAEDVEGDRPGGGSHGEAPPWGLTAPAAGAAMAIRRYFHRFGATSEDLAHVAITFREHAMLNPGAYRRTPITVADHQASRYIVEPLHLLDCCQVTDGGACILVTRRDRARAAKKPPVNILGAQGIRAGREEFIFSIRGNGVAQQSEFIAGPTEKDLTAYRMAGITRKDVDILYTYDAFSPLVWFTLERFGFVKPGEAPAFVKDGHIGLGGSLPTNTNGGLLSEGHVTGWNHLVELVRQLRGEAGGRQVKDARIAQWATAFGDSVIFGRS